MWLYTFVYALSIVSSVWWGVLVFRRYRNPSGFFLLLFSILSSVWFLLYYLFFIGIENTDTLLHISRIAFGISIAGVYSLIFFIASFEPYRRSIFTRRTVSILVAYLAVFLITASTDWVISGLRWDAASGVYRETYGVLYPLYLVLDIVFVPAFVFYSIRQLRAQTLLSRIRLKNILLSAFVLITFGFVFQLVLPYFGIWLFERELVFFFALFILSIVYTTKRYYFWGFGYGIGRVFVLVGSMAISIVLFWALKAGYVYIEGGLLRHYWGFIHRTTSVLDMIMVMAIFPVVHWFLRRVLLSDRTVLELKNQLRNIEQRLSFTTSISELGGYLSKELKRVYQATSSSIVLFDDDTAESELKRYFTHTGRTIFINDITFIEEHKHRFDREAMLGELPKGTLLAFPIRKKSQEQTIGVLTVGARLFGDFYTSYEIESLQDLAFYLGIHIHYIRAYEQIRDLSVNLDKKVDEKTLEYNHLLNQQKEFIGLVSHEIKSPIANAVFQADSIIDDLSEQKPPEEISEELGLLSRQLQDTGELISKLFSAQYYDTQDVTLFREKVRPSSLLQTEYEVYSRMHEDIHFVNEIDPDIWFAEIDRIQFQQVISNLLSNAVKFRTPEDPVVRIRAERDEEYIHIVIEDNGKGFQGIDISDLFMRYSRGGGGSIGLGLGLYLCKKIVDLHRGEISASVSESLGGARFDIRIPVH